MADTTTNDVLELVYLGDTTSKVVEKINKSIQQTIDNADKIEDMAAGNVEYAKEAGHADTADSATTAGTATNAGHANTADSAKTAETATNAGHANTADSATTAGTAANAEHANTADSAKTAETATSAGHAGSSDTATNAGHATTADTATNAGHATTADTATNAGHADTADTATNAGHADTANTATTAGSAIEDGENNVISDTYATKDELKSGIASAGKIDGITIGGKSVPVESKIAKIDISSDFEATVANGKLTLSIPELSNKATSLEFSVDNTTYVLTAKLKKADGTVLSTQTVDLPLETMVVSGDYDENTKQIVLTLKNGTTTKFSVADLISGLVSNSGTLTTDEILLGAGNGKVKTSSKKIVSNITGSSDVPTDSAVKTYVSKNAFGDHYALFSVTSKDSNEQYTKIFTSSTKNLRPLIVLNRDKEMIIVHWQMIDEKNWKLISDIALMNATAYFVSIATTTSSGGGTDSGGTGGDEGDDEPTEIYFNPDGYLYYTGTMTIDDTYGHFNEDDFYDTPILEAPDETIFRDRNNLYIELFARDSTLGEEYKGEHYFCYGLDNSVFTDEYCHNKNIIMPNFAPSIFPSWNTFIERLNSENTNDLIVDCLNGDTPYQFFTLNYETIAKRIVVIANGGDALVIGGRNRDGEFIPVDENDSIFNGCAYEVMRMDDFMEIYPQ